jgi:hypothetical protein
MTNTTTLTRNIRVVMGGVSLFSCIGFVYEITLTRLFSVILQYYNVFLLVSVAIAGLSLGAALATLLRKYLATHSLWRSMTAATIVLAGILLGEAFFLSQLRSAELSVLVIGVVIAPFVLIGLLNSIAFARFAEASSKLYAADLLGGVSGLVIAPLLIAEMGAINLLLLLVVIATTATCALIWMENQSMLRFPLIGAWLLSLVILIANLSSETITFSPEKISDAPPDKTLMAVMQDPRARLLESRWGAFARLDMVETGDDSLRYVFTDAGAGSIMVRYDGTPESAAWVQDGIEYLPFTLENTRKVLVIGAGAGRDVVMAKLAGAEDITAVEINNALVEMTRDSADYNGDIFDIPGVQTVVADGRNYIERSQEAYDLIYANVVYSQAAAPGHSALAENYIFTREALQTYWDHLAENGRIGFVTHHGIEGLRLVIAALDMLQGEGMSLPEALQHVSLASLRGGDPQSRTSVVMIMRQPWEAEQASRFASIGRGLGAGMLYLPHIQELAFEGMLLNTVTLEEYIEDNADFNYTPTTDNRPFFYQFRPGLPDELSSLLVIAVVISFAYLSWVIFFFVRQDNQHWKRASLAPYFALLGAAFLLVEIPLIQRFNLLLGQPVLSLVVVIGSLLIGSGLGSLYSNRFGVEQLPRLVSRLSFGLAVLILISLAVYPWIIRQVLDFSLLLRLLVTVIALLPLGFLMGFPFPSGLRVAHRADPNGIAAFWGANAVTSVLGSAGAMGLAVNYGFSTALALGAGLYGLVALLVYLSWHRLIAEKKA